MKKKILFGCLQVLIGLCALAQTRQVQYLSGKGSNSTVDWDFYCTAGRQSGYWTKIAVPSCWELQGFGNYNYGRDYKTYGKNARFFDEKGLYKYRFTVPASWKGRRVNIVFESSMTDTEVKINGKPAGATHQGAFYEFRCDITDLLSYGKSNLLEVTVSKMSSDASVNNAERLADYWVFGGIFRPVYLEMTPMEQIEYVGIDARADGRFAVAVHTKGLTAGRTLVAAIADAKGRIVGSATGKVNTGDSVTVLTTRVNNAAPWTAETPNLYKATIGLQSATGTIDQLTEKFGFRTIEVRRGDGIYLNGVQIKMKGANRHCFWPETGRTLNDSIQLLDFQAIKEMNMNAVRCSHYPPDKKFLELCDSLGLYVLDELAGWQKWYSTKAGEPLVREMVIRDLNHPSILFWDNGNEGGTNKELDDDFVKWDFSQRPVIHPHHRPGNQFNGIDCNHYEDYYSTRKILADSLIYMPTEFLHAQDDGGAGAAMADFWELHWHAPKSGGGFIWALVDEGVVRTDFNNVIDANGLNANDGIMGPHREKEGSFYALREIFSPVHIAVKTLAADFNGSIPVENRFHFTNLRQIRFQWALVNYRKPWESFGGYTVVQKGNATAPDIAPLDSGLLQIGLPAGFRNHDALVLVATGTDGREIYKWTWKLRNNEQLLAGILTDSTAATTLAETDSTYTLSGGGIAVILNRKTGLLQGTKNITNDNLSFANGPILVPGGTERVKTARAEGKRVSFTYDGPLKSAEWTMLGSGWVSLEYEYELNGSYPFAGVSFSYPENFMLGAKWLGKGPYRQWKNRTAGTPVNVWQNLYNQTHTSYAPLVYPEFKGYYGEITWMEFNTVEGKFYVASKDTGLSIRLFDFYGLSGARPAPELPAGNISFLDAIPAIGTKLALNISYNTSVLGPQSEPARISGPIRRTLYFYFGLPKTSDAKEQYSRPAIDNVF